MLMDVVAEYKKQLNYCKKHLKKTKFKFRIKLSDKISFLRYPNVILLWKFYKINKFQHEFEI